MNKLKAKHLIDALLGKSKEMSSNPHSICGSLKKRAVKTLSLIVAVNGLCLNLLETQASPTNPPCSQSHKISSVEARREKMKVASSPEHHDPIEHVNRKVFSFNNLVDEVFLDRISEMYRGVVPEYVRERVGYVLRNLSEPLVLTNNFLQGDLNAAGDTLTRFVINTTAGVGGIFDVSSECDIPYKKEDFGLTLASWGVEPGAYIVIPILGPSNVRDAFGRLGDFVLDPLNLWAYRGDQALYTNSRTGAQILDAKADNLDLTNDLRANSIDHYATIRTWYHERRKDLTIKPEEREALDSPRPDDDDE